MRLLSLMQEKINAADRRIRGLSLPAFISLRWCFVFVYLASFCEKFLDAGYITRTSLAYLHSSDGLPLLITAIDVVLENPLIYQALLAAGGLGAVLYGAGIGGLWVPVLFLILETFIQSASAGNIYGHEGFIHQFLFLMVLVELGQGRIRSFSQWRPSLISGLCILLLRWQLMVLYFMAGLGKWLSPEWQNSEILDRIFLNTLYRPSVFDSIYLANAWVPPILHYLIIFLQMGFPFLIWIRPARRLIFLAGIIFHTLVGLKMGIYFFSFFVISLYLLFWEEDSRASISRQKWPASPHS